MKLYILRHGETDWNKNKLLQGKSDVPLNDKGRELAKASAEGMKDIPFDLVFTSLPGWYLVTGTFRLSRTAESKRSDSVKWKESHGESQKIFREMRIFISFSIIRIIIYRQKVERA